MKPGSFMFVGGILIFDFIKSSGGYIFFNLLFSKSLSSVIQFNSPRPNNTLSACFRASFGNADACNPLNITLTFSPLNLSATSYAFFVEAVLKWIFTRSYFLFIFSCSYLSLKTCVLCFFGVIAANLLGYNDGSIENEDNSVFSNNLYLYFCTFIDSMINMFILLF